MSLTLGDPSTYSPYNHTELICVASQASLYIHRLRMEKNHLNLLTQHPGITPVICVHYSCAIPSWDRGASMVWVTKKEPADCLGISIDTVDRRLKRGELRGRQQARPQGFTWLIEVPDETYNQDAKEESPQLGTPVMTPQSTPD
jgi:hypothetical protein